MVSRGGLRNPRQPRRVLTYTRRKQSLAGLNYTHKFSINLAGWAIFTFAAPVSSDNGDPVEAITVTIPAELLARPTLFLRVEATRP